MGFVSLNDIAHLLHDNSFARILVDSLPCGFLIVDGQGRVQVVNNILERVLKVSKQASIPGFFREVRSITLTKLLLQSVTNIRCLISVCRVIINPELIKKRKISCVNNYLFLFYQFR